MSSNLTSTPTRLLLRELHEAVKEALARARRDTEIMAEQSLKNEDKFLDEVIRVEFMRAEIDRLRKREAFLIAANNDEVCRRRSVDALLEAEKLAHGLALNEILRLRDLLPL